MKYCKERTAEALSTIESLTISEEFKVDFENFTITYRDLVFDKIYSDPLLHPTVGSAYYDHRREGGQSLDLIDYSTTLSTFFNVQWGLPIENFREQFKILQESVWIKREDFKIEEYLYPKFLDESTIEFTVYNYWKSKPLVEQCLKDNIRNIIPFVVRTALSPKELRKQFGKSLWKRLCKRSFEINRFLASYTYTVRLFLEGIEVLSSPMLKEVSRYSDKEIEFYISFLQLQEKETELLRGRLGLGLLLWSFRPSIFESLISNPVGWGKFKQVGLPPLNNEVIWFYHNIAFKHHTNTLAGDLIKWLMLMHDTRGMANILGLAFSYSWSPEKLQHRHGAYTRLINLRKYSPTPLFWLTHITPKRFEYKGFVAELITSLKQLGEEGEALHHCVGSYAKEYAKGEYLIYGVTYGGKRSSTLAYRVSSGVVLEFSLNQIQGPYNKSVSDTEELLSGYLLEQLNKQTILTEDIERDIQRWEEFEVDRSAEVSDSSSDDE